MEKFKKEGRKVVKKARKGKKMLKHWEKRNENEDLIWDERKKSMSKNEGEKE